jgi:hypothetical protein
VLQRNGQGNIVTKNPAAVALGKMGGEATAKKLTAEERKKSASKAAQARWKKAKGK